MAFDGVSNLYSGTNFADFNPRIIPYQSAVIDLIDEWDFSKSTPEILLSGSYGSAKSILMAHLAVRHCLENPGARVCLARKALPDLKDTIFKEVLEHIAEDFTEGVHYWINQTSAKVRWFNGSEIISRSWADKKYKKGRSLKLSMLIFEELTENNDDDKEAFETLKARLRRLPKVKENILIAATNPDSPAHWVYKYWFSEEKAHRKTFKSVTTDNPFLDPIYIKQLLENMDPKAARRYIHGEWIELSADVIYYAYDSEVHFKKTLDYTPSLSLPISIFFDFNIGLGKPMSVGVGQYDPGVDHFHIFDEAIIPGARTESMLEELSLRGHFDHHTKVYIYGDATGESQSTKSIHSDYDLIRKFISNYKRPDGSSVQFEMRVPRANPPIRKRHNLLNAYLKNAFDKVRLSVYKKCKVTDEGLKLTALKKGADYIEDDSKHFQHITTAIGYWIVSECAYKGLKQAGTTDR